MPATIYEKSVKELMRDFAAQKLEAGTIFTLVDITNWFAANYPRISRKTVRLSVNRLSINYSYRLKRPRILPGKGYDLFYRIGTNKYRLWDANTDQAPLYYQGLSTAQSRTETAVNDDEDFDEVGAVEDLDADLSSTEFAFENDLRNYLVKNMESLEKGLRLYVDEESEEEGVEFPAGGRYIDILGVDGNGDFVVIELKVSRGYDRVVGQLLRYMEWVDRNLANGKKVHGIIVASEITEDLKLACARIPGVKLVEYELSFKLKTVSVK